MTGFYENKRNCLKAIQKMVNNGDAEEDIRYVALMDYGYEGKFVTDAMDIVRSHKNLSKKE